MTIAAVMISVEILLVMLLFLLINASYFKSNTQVKHESNKMFVMSKLFYRQVKINPLGCGIGRNPNYEAKLLNEA